MKKTSLALATFLLIYGGVMAQQKAKPATAATSKAQTVVMKSDLDSMSYAIGMSVAQFYQKQGIKNFNVALVQKGIGDAATGKAVLSDQQMEAAVMAYMQKMQNEKMEATKKANAPIIAANKKAAAAFLAENKTKPGVVTLPSGLQYQVIKEGTGPKPTINDNVKCHYHGTLLDGTVFDSSVDRGEPISFPVGGVIKGWVEALQLMPVGSKWKLFIPSDLAYGDNQAGPKITPGSMLIFDVELLSIEKAPQADPATQAPKQ